MYIKLHLNKQNISYFPNLLNKYYTYITPHIFIQETNNPETKDNVSTGAEYLDNKDANEVRAEEGTYVKQLTNVEIPKSEIKGN